MLALLCLTAVCGQEPPSDPPAAATVYPADGLFAAEPVLLDCPWRTDVVFGLPLALRAQRRVADTRVWGEVGVAAYVIVPSVFGGLRFDGKLHDSPTDGLSVRPGFDFYYSPIRGGGGFLFDDFRGIAVTAIDFDVIWRHRWADRFHGQVGMKLGAGAGFAGGHVFPVPILGMTFGCQF